MTRDRLVYFYDDAGRVGEIRYTDSTGAVYKRLRFAYDGRKLIRLERERRSDAGFFVDKTMSMSYGADGNLLELIDRRTDVRGSPQGDTYVDRFEQYDDGLNVDGFSLLHNEVSDHLILLPDAHRQALETGRALLPPMPWYSVGAPQHQRYYRLIRASRARKKH